MTNVLELRSQTVGVLATNAYVLVCPETRHSVLIDPAAEPSVLQQLLHDTTPVALLLTHSHADHIGALRELRERLRVPLLAHGGPHVRGATIHDDRALGDGERVAVGNHELIVRYTPGHTEDMLCFLLADDHRAIVGDTIFDGGPGKTDTPEDFGVTLYTLRTVVLSWHDDTICYPGHGPAFRLGDRRAAIESFLDKDHGNFCGDASWDR